MNSTKKIKSIKFFPHKWNDIDDLLKEKFKHIDLRLQKIFFRKPINHCELKELKLNTINLLISDDIQDYIKRRQFRRFEMGKEHIVVKLLLSNNEIENVDSIYQLACETRNILFGSKEVLRTTDLTFTFFKSLRITPPDLLDPIFNKFQLRDGEASLFCALNAYLVILSAHPFSDGNGRVSRVIFNYILSRCYSSVSHYIPLAELFHTSNGIYEELFARASIDGRYTELIYFFLSTIEAYIDLVECTELDSYKDVELAADYYFYGNELELELTTSSPFAIDYDSLLLERSHLRVGEQFVRIFVEICKELMEICQPIFVLIKLSSLFDEEFISGQPITFFVDGKQTDLLVARSRMLVNKYYSSIRINFSVITHNHVLNAKLLAYSIEQLCGNDYSDGLAIIYNFKSL